MTTFPPEFQLPAEPPQWPKNLGILAIVFGILGALGGLCGALGAVAGEYMQTFAGVNAEQMPAALNPKFVILSAVVQIIGMGVAIILLVGAIKLTKRRAKSRTILLTWAAIKIVLVFASSFVGFFTIKHQFSAMPTQGGQSLFTAETVEMLAIGGTAIGVLWGIALPVFMLIWLCRVTIRAEIASWS